MPLFSFLRRGKSKLQVPSRRGTFRKPKKLLYQNYETLLEMCLKNKCLFKDKNFPADISSIGKGLLLQKLPSKLQWKRPHELHKTPLFYTANTRQLDLCQGLIDNCWFLAALQALTYHQDILAVIVPQNQSFDRKYAGIFHFRFWHFGEWVDVVVDDQLPVNEAGQLVFLSSACKNVFWGALLEKAYAKLYGSYEDLQIGNVSEALVDFTGGVNMTIKLAEAPPDLWNILTRATCSRSLMGCQTHLGTTQVLENGLVVGHAYTVTGMRKVTCKCGSESLVRLRNPWGKIEWKGAWSDSSENWELLSPKEKILLRRYRDDGEFWMSLQDFKTHFVELVICKLTPDLMSQEGGKKWMYSLKMGRWVKGNTAGIRTRPHTDAFWMNPQYWLQVLPGDGSKNSLRSCSVLVSLIQKPRSKHRNWAPLLPIGISIFKVAGEYYKFNRRLPPAFFAMTPPINQNHVFVNKREVTQDFRLQPGVYIIVPSTAETQQESEFVLRVFSRKHVLREVGSDSSFILCKEIIDKHEGKIWEDFLNKHFEQNPEINAVQLQMILNNVVWTNPQDFWLRFSLDACQGMLALLDLNTTGTLNIQEFRVLWKRLLFYLEVFQKKDVDRTGTLNLVELHEAVKEIGISHSNKVCNLMAIRYGNNDLQINFESFFCFLLRVEIMGEAFRNLTKDGKGIYLQESEWMMMTLYS
ncbi:calpain-14-like [Carettochelys insculpta]|uniref:calpain-14-like n=1 Tax=Carettochelys insculpta TaxID=44489 RepID=UPI003EC066DA